MSLTAVRPYFKARFEALNYTEWESGFSFDNIPEDIIDSAFHVSDFDLKSVKQNQTDLELDVSVETRVFVKGFANMTEALDNCNERLEAILVEVLKPTNRLTGTQGLRNVKLISVSKEPISVSNDAIVLMTCVWSVQVNMCT